MEKFVNVALGIVVTGFILLFIVLIMVLNAIY